MLTQQFSRDVLPSRPRSWQLFQKKNSTRMVRIEGPFVVDTQEGPVFCPDGWLALDAAGYPYPVSVREHQLSYRPLEAEHAGNSLQKM